MDSRPSQHQAHLMVAGVRVLEHQHNRPPSVNELAALLGISREVTGHQVRVLETLGILQTIKSPFDLRVELDDYRQIEALPVEETGPGFKDEVEDFHRKFEKKQKDLQNLFDSGEQEKRQKERFSDLDSELEEFRSPKRSNPFGED